MYNLLWNSRNLASERLKPRHWRSNDLYSNWVSGELQIHLDLSWYEINILQLLAQLQTYMDVTLRLPGLFLVWELVKHIIRLCITCILYATICRYWECLMCLRNCRIKSLGSCTVNFDLASTKYDYIRRFLSLVTMFELNGGEQFDKKSYNVRSTELFSYSIAPEEGSCTLLYQFIFFNMYTLNIFLKV